MLESLGTVDFLDMYSLMKEKPFYGTDIKEILDSLTYVSSQLSDTMYIIPFLGSTSDIEKVLQKRVVEVREALGVLERLRYSAHTGLSTIADEYYFRIPPNESKGYLVRAYQFDGDFVDKDGKWYAPRWIQMEYILGRLYYSGPELYIYKGNDKEHPDTLVPVNSYIVNRLDSPTRELVVISSKSMEDNFKKVKIEIGRTVL